jgi:anti-sigma factor RsiW
MKCPKQSKLSAYLDDELPEEEQREIERHLDGCSACRMAVERLRMASSLSDPFGEIEPSPWFTLQVRKRIAKERSGSRIPVPVWVRRLANPLVPAGAAALLALSLVFGTIIGRTVYPASAADSKIETTKLLSFGSLDDFPEGSLGAAYADLLVGGGE